MINPTAHKARCFVYGGLLLLAGFVMSCDTRPDGPDAGQPRPLNEDALLGDVWAMSYPTALGGYAADHTYVQALDQDGNAFTWMCFGSYTKGDVLENTTTHDYADIETIGFMASEAPCKWPTEDYMRVGICYQCANRALYYTGKTVEAAPGYVIFALFFGTYGDEDCEDCGDYRMADCLAAAPEWGGVVYRSDAGVPGDPAAATLQETSQAEIALYERYRTRRQSLAVEPGGRSHFRQYLDDLLEMMVRQRLGDDVAPETIDGLKQIRDEFLDRKAQLDSDSRTAHLANEDRKAAYTALFIDLAGRYREVLSSEDYEILFNLPYGDDTAIADFLQ